MKDQDGGGGGGVGWLEGGLRPRRRWRLLLRKPLLPIGHSASKVQSMVQVRGKSSSQGSASVGGELENDN